MNYAQQQNKTKDNKDLKYYTMKRLFTVLVVTLIGIVSLRAQFTPDFTFTAPFSNSSTTTGAVNDCALRSSEDHVYQVIINTAGTYVFSLCGGASWDTYMYLGSGVCLGNIALNDDFCSVQSEITIFLTPGAYYLTIEGFSSGSSGSYTLNVSMLPPPAPSPISLCNASYTSSPSLAIPDPGTVSNDLVITGTGLGISDLNVSLNILHTWVGDLDVTLTHVNTGTSVVIFDRPGVPASTFGCSSNDIDVALDDEAGSPVEAECNLLSPAIFGTFTPNNPLSAFDGEALDGTWRLTVTDNAGFDAGTLVSWCLDPTTYSLSPGCTSPYASSPSLAIPDNNLTGVTDDIVIPVTNTDVITDLDVYLDISHTFVGDLTVEITHVNTGTTVRIVEAPGGPPTSTLCPNDDIMAELDDQALTPVETECSAIPPAIAGSFIPNNPLSAFNGETMAGTWRIRVIDDATGDQGTLNTWCFNPTTIAGIPYNDSCHKAYDLVCGDVVTGTTINATLDVGAMAPFCSTAVTAPGVWYTVEGNGDFITASLCTGTTYDSKINVYTGSCNGLICVGGDDDFCGFAGPSQFTWLSEPCVTYYILVQGFSGQTGDFTLGITCASPPTPLVADAGPDQSFCYDGGANTAILGGSPTGSGGHYLFPYHYSWSPSTGLNSTTVANPVFSPPGPGTYTFTVTVTDTCGLTDSDQVTITVWPNPNANAGADQAFCASQLSTTIGGSPTASGGTPGYTYSWSPTTGLSSAAASNPTFTHPGPGTYTFTVTVTDANGCQDQDDVTITVWPLPIAVAGGYFYGQDTTVCLNEPVLLGGMPTASGGTPGYTYSWTPSSGLSCTTCPNPIALPQVTTTYTLVVTDANGCTDEDTVRVKIFPLTPVTFTGLQSDYCLDDVPSLLVPSIPGGTFSGPGITTLGGGGTPYSSSYGGGSVAIPDNSFPGVQVFHPVVGIPGTALGVDVQLDSVSFDISHTWVGDLVVILVSPSGDTVQLAERPGLATYFGCCGCSSNDILATVTTGTGSDMESVCNPFPAITGTYTAHGGADLNSLNNGISPNGSWSLLVRDLAGADLGTVNGFTLYFSTNVSGGTYFDPGLAGVGTHTIVYEYIDINGCANYDTQYTEVHPLPVADAGPDATICDNVTHILGGSPTASAGTPGYTYLWTPATDLSSDVVANPVFTPPAPGTYTYSVLVTDSEGCTDFDNVTITVIPAPVADAGMDKEVCADCQGVVIGGYPSATGGTGFYSYQWIPTTGLSNPNHPNPIANPGVTTTYTLVVLDLLNGCPDSSEVTVTVNPLPTPTFFNLSSDYCIDDASVVLNGAPAGGVFFGPGLTSSPGMAPFVSCYLGSPLAIPDNMAPLQVQQLVDGLQGDTLGTDVWLDSMSFVIDHTWVGDLVITLENPGGTVITLADRPGEPASFFGCSGDNIIATIIPGTGSDMENVCNGYIPAIHGRYTAHAGADLNSLNDGSDPNGIWRLRITDIIAGDIGDFLTMTLYFTHEGFSHPVTFTPALADTGTHEIIYWYTDANGCYNSDTQTTTVHPLPTANAGLDVDLCYNDVVVIGGTPAAVGTAPFTYQWWGPVGLSSYTTANPTFDPQSAGTFTYILTVTDAFGCQNTDTMVITVYPQPIADAGTNHIICFDETATLGGSPTASGGTPAYSYYWTPTIGLNNANAANPVFTPFATGTYNYMLQVVDANGCRDTAYVSVTVNPVPVANAGLDVTLCSNESTTLGGSPSASAGTPPYNYAWSPASGLSAANVPNPTFTGSTAGTYTYILTVIDVNGCTDADTVVVTVNPTPVANAGSDVDMCVDWTATLGGSPTASGGTPGYFYIWSPSTGLNFTSIANPTFTPPAPGSYTFTVIVIDVNGCSDTDMVNVTVNPLPTLSINGLASEYCLNDIPVNITGSPAGGTFSGNGISNNIPVTLYNATYNGPVVTISNTNPNGESSATMPITTAPGTLLGADIRLDSVSFYVSHTWTGDVDVELVSPDGTSQYLFRYYDGCSYDNIDVTTIPGTGSAPYCNGGPFNGVTGTFTASGGYDLANFNNGGPVNGNWMMKFKDWYGGDDGTLTSWTMYFSTLPGAVFDPGSAGVGIHTVYYTYTDGNGCTNVDSQSVIVHPLPVADAGTDTAFCLGGVVTLGGNPTGSAGTPGYTYLWSPSTYLSSATDANPVMTATAPGTYTYTVAVSDTNGCTVEDDVVITVWPLPVADAGSDLEMCDGETIIIGGSPTASGGTPGYTYSWTPTSGLDDATAANPTAGPLAPGTYTYTILVTDANGCTDVDDMVLTVHPLPVVDFTGLDSMYCANDPAVLLTGIPSGGIFTGPGVTTIYDTITVPGMNAIGSGTSVHGTTTAGPVNIYYRRSVEQFVYTAAELNSYGIFGPASIDQLGWYVVQAPIYNIPGYTIKMKHTTASNVASALGTTGWTTVKNAFTYAPTAGGYDMLLLDQPFVWDGVSNIGVELCWSQVTPTWNSSGTVRYTSTSSGFRYSRTDASGSSCGLTPTGVTVYKPHVQLGYSSTSIIPVGAGFDPGTAGAGTHTVYYTYTDSNGCTNVDSQVVIVNPVPVVDAGADTAICIGESVILGGSPTASGGIPGFTYSWSPTTGLNDATLANPTFTPADTGAYSFTVTVIDTMGCSDMDAIDIFVNPLPDIDIVADPDDSICYGDTVCLTVVAAGSGPACSPTDQLTTTFAGGNGQNGAMFDITALNDVVITNFDGSAFSTGTFSYEIYYKDGSHVGFETNPGAWTLLGTGTVSVTAPNSPHAIPISVCVPIDAGQTAAFYVTTTGSTIAYTNGSGVGNVFASDANIQFKEGVGKSYPFGSTFSPRIWNGIIHYGTGGSSAAGNIMWSTGDTTGTICVAPLATTTYYAWLTDGNGCTGMDSITINVNPEIIIDAGADAAICLNDCITLGGNPTASGGTPGYTYTWSPSHGLSSTHVANPVACPTMTTTYALEVVDDRGCVVYDTVTITVNPLPIADAGSDKAFCIGLSDVIGGNPTGSAGTAPYTYSWSPATGLSSATDANPTASPTVTTVYTVTVTDVNGCIDIDSMTVTVWQLDDATITPAGPFCVDDVAVNLTAATPGGSWSGNGITNSSMGTFDPSVAGVGTHMIVYYVASLYNCPNWDTAYIVVNALPAPNVTSGNIFCINGGTSTLTADIAGGTWTGNGITNASAGTFDPAVAGLGNHLITYAVTDTNGCTGETTVTVTVYAAPDATINPVGPYCTNDPAINLTAATAGGTWSGNGITNATLGTFDPSVAGAGTHTITYTITDVNGCTSSATTTITVNGPSAFTVNPAGPYCENDNPSLITATIGGGYWTGPGIVNPLNGLFHPGVAGPGGHTVTYTVTNASGCTLSNSIVVQVFAKPNATINNPGPFCANDAAANLTAATPGGTWSGPGITNATLGTFDPNVSGAGTFTVTYTVTNANGCTNSATELIVVNPLPVISGTVTDVNCAGDIDGSIDITVGGAAPPYIYAWSNGATTQDIDEIGVGTYTLTVTDQKGCQNTATFTVNSLSVPMSTTANITPATAPTYDNGAIDLTVNGGTPPFTFVWSNGATSEDISGLRPDSFRVTITDAIGCIYEIWYHVPADFGIGIDLNDLANNIALYPNPTSDVINIEIEIGNISADMHMTVFDVLGRKVYEVSDAISNKFTHQIDLVDWASGHYMIRFNIGDEVVAKKFILTR